MITGIFKKALRKVKSIARQPALGQPASPRTHIEAEAWRRTAQEGEFRFHLKNKWRQSDSFMEQTIELFDHFGFTQNDFYGKTIIDLGAGSKLRSKYFVGANIIVIEPLADQFMKRIKWCDLADAKEIYSTPAEVRIEECVGRADLVISINVLDHCYDFELIIENIAAYLKDDGVAFLSFDLHEEVDEMHPLILTEPICERIFAQKGLVVESLTKGAGEILLNYGGVSNILNCRLKKAQQRAPADA